MHLDGVVCYDTPCQFSSHYYVLATSFLELINEVSDKYCGMVVLRELACFLT